MIRQIKASDIPAGRPALEGKIFAVRVVQFTQGDTISFDDPKAPITIYAPGATYRKRTGWKQIWLTAAASTVIECVTEVGDAVDFDAANAALAGTQGLAAAGSAAAGNPVLVGGLGGDGLVRTLLKFARDEWLDLIRAGKAFGFGTGVGSGVGNFSVLQLWNPVGSGVRILVASARGGPVAGGAAMDWRLTLESAQLALGTALGPGKNLLAGGAGPQGVVRSNATIAALSGNILAQPPSSDNLAHPRGWVAELPEGWGIDIWALTTNQGSNNSIFWAEVATSTYPA